MTKQPFAATHLLRLFPLLLLLGACGSESVPEVVDPAEEAMARGQAAFEQLQFGQAAEAFSSAIQLDSTRADAYLMRGQVRWMSQQFDKAVTDLDRAIGLDSSLAWAYFFRGSSHFSLDHFPEALDDLEVAASSGELPDEDRARAHRMRAILYMASDRFGESIDALSHAITLRPDLSLYYFERGLLYAAAERPTEAENDLERFLSLDSTANENTAFARQKLDSLRASGT